MCIYIYTHPWHIIWPIAYCLLSMACRLLPMPKTGAKLRLRPMGTFMGGDQKIQGRCATAHGLAKDPQKG